MHGVVLLYILKCLLMVSWVAECLITRRLFNATFVAGAGSAKHCCQKPAESIVGASPTYVSIVPCVGFDATVDLR